MVLRGWLTAALAYLAASGVLTLVTDARSPALQFVQLAHTAIALVATPVWVAYVAVHLAQLVRDRRRVAWSAVVVVSVVSVVPVARSLIGAGLNLWLNRFVAALIGLVVLLTLRAFWRAIRDRDSPWALGALFLGCSVFAVISGLLVLADAQGSFYWSHVIGSALVVAASIAHVAASRRGPRRHTFPWRVTLRRTALPTFAAATGCTAILAVAVQVSSRVPEPDSRAIVPAEPGFTAVAADVCDDCHATVLRTWEDSSHAHAASNPVFTALFRRAVEAGRTNEARRCLACHAPHAADPTRFSPEEVIASEGYRVGVHCVSCHRMRDPAGPRDGEFAIRPFASEPSTFLIEQAGDFARVLRAHRFTSKSTVATRIDRHRSHWRPGPSRPTTCRPCHVQTLGPMTGYALTEPLQDQYDAWRASPGAADRDCIDCHMLSVYGEEGYTLIDHRFAAASTYVGRFGGGELGESAAVASLEGGWLPPAGSILPTGTAAGDAKPYGTVEGPASVDVARATPPQTLLEMEIQRVASEAGSGLRIQTWNSGRIGHDFPNGPTDLIQVWLRILATDASGAILVDQGRDGPTDAIRLGHRLLDEAGREVAEHRLWEVREVVDRGRIPVRGRHTIDVPLPGHPVLPIRVEASWRYRRIDPALVEALVGGPPEGITTVIVGQVVASID